MFILNNESYLTIKHTQEMFFEDRYSGSESSSGYSAPDFTEIGRAYKITSYKLDNQTRLRPMIKHVLSAERENEPVLCEVMMPADQPLIPLSLLDKSRLDRFGAYSGSPVERMYPFLSEEEHRENMIVEPV